RGPRVARRLAGGDPVVRNGARKKESRDKPREGRGGANGTEGKHERLGGTLGTRREAEPPKRSLAPGPVAERSIAQVERRSPRGPAAGRAPGRTFRARRGRTDAVRPGSGVGDGTRGSRRARAAPIPAWRSDATNSRAEPCACRRRVVFFFDRADHERVRDRGASGPYPQRTVS